MRNCSKIVLSALLMGSLFLPLAVAQPETAIAKVTIPFDFWIGAEKFPAGEYTLDSLVPSFVAFRSKDGRINEQVPTLLYADPVTREEARLVFSRRNGRYYLSEVWGILGKRTMTADLGRARQKDDVRHEVRLTYP
jgi:hypothetical protein